MKMKRYTIMMSLATVLLGLMSCSSEEGNGNMTATADLQLTTEISTTRSIIEGETFSYGDVVQLYVSGEAEGKNFAWAYNDAGKWIIDPTIKLNNNHVGVVGVANLLNRDITPDEKGDQSDILLGLPTLADNTYITAANPVVPMKFHHVLARVSFQLKQTGGSDQLTRLSLKNIDNGNAITVQCDSMKVVEAARWASEYMIGNPNYSQLWKAFEERILSYLYTNRIPADLTLNKTVTLSEETQTIDLLVIPTSINSYNRVALELTIGGNAYSIELPYTSWNSNVRYVYPVNIDTSKDMPVSINIDKTTIERWNYNGKQDIEETWPLD